MTEYEYLMEKRAAADSVETRKIKLGPRDPDWLTVEQISGRHNDDVSKAILKYKKSPTADNFKDLVLRLGALEKANPAHLHGGLYAGTKDTASRAGELLERGNYTRGLIGSLLGVPLAAVHDTIALPVNLVARAYRPSVNTKFRNIDALAKEDPLNVATNLRAANELLHILRTKRPDPTSQGEGLKTLASNWSGALYKDAPSAITGSPMSATLPVLPPGTGNQLGDVLAFPHTALLNALDWNGITREEWEKEQREKSASADLTALKSALRESSCRLEAALS